MANPRMTLETRRLFRFAEVIGNRHLIRVTVGPDFHPVILSLERDPNDRLKIAGGNVPKSRAGQPNCYRIHHRVAEELWLTLDLSETLETFHAIQPLGDVEWLLVRGRADNDGDRNAHVYDASGGHSRSFHAGDGVQDVQATRGGEVWVSYFDEGVFGSTVLGQSGLVRLDGSGNCSFEFNRLAGGGLPDIADCYALNVASDQEVWLCYYTDFPLVRLVDGKVDDLWLRFPVQARRALQSTGKSPSSAAGTTTETCSTSSDWARRGP